MNEALIKIASYAGALRRDEDGAALTEYLILLGLLAGGAVAAVSAFGGGIDTAFDSWLTWLGSNAGSGAS